MNAIRFLLLLFVLLPFQSALSQIASPAEISDAAKAKAPHISVDDMKSELAAEKQPLVIDVRTEKEYLAGHLKGAMWIPRGKVKFDIQKVATDPDHPIILYCRTGGRSALATLALKGIGYRNVKNLDGGFKAWVEAGNPVFTMHGETLVVSYGKEE